MSWYEIVDVAYFYAAKYNKAKKPKKPTPQKKTEEDEEEEEEEDKGSDGEEEEENVEAITFTLKQLIRKLHIVEPVEHVMCLLGKR